MLPNIRRRTFVACCCAALASCAGLPASAPPAPRHAEVNGTKLAYVEQGRGTTVVFVHGSISDWRTWESQRPAFAARYRYVAYSQRYFGTDPWPDDGRHFSPTTHAADLAAFIRSLNAGPVHLVGWSYGGAVMSLVAAEHPQLVRTLSMHEPVIRPLLADTGRGQAVDRRLRQGRRPGGRCDEGRRQCAGGEAVPRIGYSNCPAAASTPMR